MEVHAFCLSFWCLPLYVLGLVAALVSLTSPPALADCANPPAPEGRLVYNVTSKVAQVCDGTNWIALSGSGGGGGGSITVPGNDTEVIFNDGGALGSDAAFVFNKGTGHVGIGVASPTLPLDVGGFVGTTGIQLTPTAADAPVPAGAPTLGNLADVDTSARANGRVLTYNSTTSQWEAAAASGGTVTGAAGSTGHVQFNNAGAFAADAALFWDNTNRRLGIGTATPDYKLDVVGPLIRVTDNDSAGQIRIGDGSGYSGDMAAILWAEPIGNNRPLWLLSQIRSEDDTGATPAILLAGRVGNSNNIANRQIMAVQNHNTNLLNILANGNIGIGTNAPTATLHVAATGMGLRLLTGTSSSGYTADIGVNDDGVNFSNNSAARGYNFKNSNGTLTTISPAGKINATAFGLDIQRVSNSVSAIGNKSATANCATNYTLVGGGCMPPAWGGILVQSYPSTATQWACSSTDSYGTSQTLTAYAICVKTGP